jgi:hypothetical protein
MGACGFQLGGGQDFRIGANLNSTVTFHLGWPAAVWRPRDGSAARGPVYNLLASSIERRRPRWSTASRPGDEAPVPKGVAAAGRCALHIHTPTPGQQTGRPSRPSRPCAASGRRPQTPDNKPRVSRRRRFDKRAASGRRHAPEASPSGLGRHVPLILVLPDPVWPEVCPHG